MNRNIASAINTLDEGAVFVHEMFLAYVRAGFDENQALAIIIATMNRQQEIQAQGGGGCAHP
jgi:hypothetical protein